MFARHFLAVATTFALVSSTTLGNPEMLGVVTQATDATLGTGPLSVGASIFDGDRLSTDAAGALTVRGAAVILYLARASRVTLRSLPNKAKGTQADLNAGSLAFSAPKAAALVIFADSARIRSIGEAATAGQVTILDPKTLYIYARQGTLGFSYQDESEVVQEGKAYRVTLDPPDEDSSAKPGDPTTRTRTNRRRKGFLFVLLGLGSALGGVVKTMGDVQSPDHP